MFTSIRRASFAAIAASLVATPAFAAPVETAFEPRTSQVQLADLDLRRDDDVKRLQSRIRAAATNVCGRLGRMSLSQSAKVQSCHRDAVTTARRHADEIVVAVRAGKDQRLAVRESLRVIAR
ncbi:UrcA family protein [Sphingomonas zeicaulis]|uniref:UrcA family protein n=1 Tax=Sphingomonas zeicaulis TaxID=1632740 RepID=UPI003D19AF53